MPKWLLSLPLTDPPAATFTMSAMAGVVVIPLCWATTGRIGSSPLDVSESIVSKGERRWSPSCGGRYIADPTEDGIRDQP